MPLDLGGGFNNVKWLASRQKWFLGDDEVELSSAIFDLENLRQGWISLAKGEAPQEVWDNGRRGAKPTEAGDWKRGFEVNVYAPKAFGDEEPRRFMTNGVGSGIGINKLYVEYEAQAAANPGKVPLCKFEGGDEISTSFGSTSSLKLSIARWIERPDALSGGGVSNGDSPEADIDSDDVEF